MYRLNIVTKPSLRILSAIALAALGTTALRTCAAADATESQYILEKEPEGAVDVLAARKEAKGGDNVLVIGRIGGRPNPWIKGMAAFPIVDRSLTPCNEIEGDTCKTPWDYCCEPDLAEATVLVTFVDESGKVFRKDPRKLLHVKELSTVVVQGKAKRDKEGNMTILASKVHVVKDDKVAR